MDEIHGPKNALLKFMDLSVINYKFMDRKMRFLSLWTYVFKVYGPKCYKLQVDGPKCCNAFWMVLNDTPLQVGGPLVHFALIFLFMVRIWSMFDDFWFVVRILPLLYLKGD